MKVSFLRLAARVYVPRTSPAQLLSYAPRLQIQCSTGPPQAEAGILDWKGVWSSLFWGQHAARTYLHNHHLCEEFCQLGSRTRTKSRQSVSRKGVTAPQNLRLTKAVITIRSCVKRCTLHLVLCNSPCQSSEKCQEFQLLRHERFLCMCFQFNFTSMWREETERLCSQVVLIPVSGRKDEASMVTCKETLFPCMLILEINSKSIQKKRSEALRESLTRSPQLA